MTTVADPGTDEERAYYALQERVWSWFARPYDAIVVPLRRFRREVAARIVDGAGTRILDVATGTGEQARAFARAGAEVVAVDLCPAMLRVARSKGALPNLTFELADATRLPFADGAFDVSSVSFALHEMPPSVRERAVNELARVTRPGGTVAVVDWGLPAGPFGRAVVPRVVGLFERDTYVEFVHSDLRALLGRAGIDVATDERALGGVARIVIGRRRS